MVGERQPRRHQRGAALEDVAAVDDGAEDRGVRRRAADAALLQRPDQGRLGVAGRRLTSRGRPARATARRAASPWRSCGSRRSRSSSSSRRVVVAALLVGGEEAAEGDDRAGGRELGVAAVRGRRAEPHRDGLAAGVGHLRGDGALPDQLVERELVAAELAGQLSGRAERVTGRADRLVRLLRVLDLALVAARHVRHVLRAVDLAGLRTAPRSAPTPTASSSRCACR